MSVTKRERKEVRPDNGVECTCADGGDEEKCEKCAADLDAKL